CTDTAVASRGTWLPLPARSYCGIVASALAWSAPMAPSNVVLQRFFEQSEAARRASSSLKKAAQVAVRFTDVPGDFVFRLIEGKPRLCEGRAEHAGFELTMAPGAVTASVA